MAPFLVGLAVALTACTDKKPSSSSGGKGKDGSSDGKDGGGDGGGGDASGYIEEDDTGAGNNTPKLNGKQVAKLLEQQCAECHGKDEDGTPRPNHSAWPVDKKSFSLKELEVSTYAPIAYASMFNRVAKKASDSPSPMPPDKPDDEVTAQLKGAIGWFNINLPFVVAEAEQTYGLKVKTGGESNTAIRFRCSSPISGRLFLSRMTNALFDRPPNPDELKILSEEELTDGVTKATRLKIVGLLRGDDWRNEFKETGLRKLAAAIGGGPAIKPLGALTPEIVTDLKDEFYQLVKANYDDWEYPEFLTSSKVMVSENTAGFYGCSGEADPYWTECTMKKPRKGLFTTMGFLSSRQTSFLLENNNYGRVALVYFTLMGQSFAAATDGPVGEKVSPLPGCLETDDLRLRGGAPRGTASIPAFGNVCQACHIMRNLASGSVLFRPFAPTGELYSADNLTTLDPELFKQATAEDWTYLSEVGDDFDSAKPVDEDFLKNLLDNKPKACAVSPIKGKKDVPLATVDDMVSHLMKNESALVRGFIRHAHRAYSSSQTVNFDLVYTALKTYESGKKRIPDLLQSYFMSETYACSDEEGGGG